MIATRRGVAADLEAIAAIQAASPQASQWAPADYLEYELRVATIDGVVAGFLAGRTIAGIEYEILNLAVAPGFRRQGVARALFLDIASTFRGTVFLEVRDSNSAALAFYKSLGFQQLSRRENYYTEPREAGIVMKFHSC